MSTEPVHPEAVERERLARMCEEQGARADEIAAIAHADPRLREMATDWRKIAAIVRGAAGESEETREGPRARLIHEGKNPREATKPDEVGVIWFDTLEAIHGAFAEGWAEGVASWGGETVDGQEVTYTTDQMLDGMRAQGMWGFEKGGTIHLWAEPEHIGTPDLAHLIAHEIAHAACSHDGTLADELEAERYGAVAAQTVRVMDMIRTRPTSSEETRGQKPADTVEYVRALFEEWMADESGYDQQVWAQLAPYIAKLNPEPEQALEITPKSSRAVTLEVTRRGHQEHVIEPEQGQRIEGWAHTGEHFVRFVADNKLAEDRSGYGLMLDFERATLIIHEQAKP